MMLLTQLDTGDVLFIDEVHRLNKAVEEFLYPALEDFRVDYTTESGIGGRTVNFNLKRFTLVGATTRAGLLSAALRSRIGLPFHLQYYTDDELVRIVTRSAALLKVPAEPDALKRLAGRSRGTPRIVNRLLRRVRDYAEVRGDGRLTPAIVDAALDILQIDALGLDELDRQYLEALIRHYDGGPGGHRSDRRQHGPRARHARGRGRALPAPDWLRHPHAPRPRRAPRGVHTPRPHPARQTRRRAAGAV